LLTEQDFNDAVAAGAAIVLIDSASPPKLHTVMWAVVGIAPA
jgi:hypothetical protein